MLSGRKHLDEFLPIVSGDNGAEFGFWAHFLIEEEWISGRVVGGRIWACPLSVQLPSDFANISNRLPINIASWMKGVRP